MFVILGRTNDVLKMEGAPQETHAEVLNKAASLGGEVKGPEDVRNVKYYHCESTCPLGPRAGKPSSVVDLSNVTGGINRLVGGEGPPSVSYFLMAAIMSVTASCPAGKDLGAIIIVSSEENDVKAREMARAIWNVISKRWPKAYVKISIEVRSKIPKSNGSFRETEVLVDATVLEIASKLPDCVVVTNDGNSDGEAVLLANLTRGGITSFPKAASVLGFKVVSFFRGMRFDRVWSHNGVDVGYFYNLPQALIDAISSEDVHEFLKHMNTGPLRLYDRHEIKAMETTPSNALNVAAQVSAAKPMSLQRSNPTAKKPAAN